MIAPIHQGEERPSQLRPSTADVPADLLTTTDRWKTFHQWKSSAVVKACEPLRKVAKAPRAVSPGILMYHRVVPAGRHRQPTWNVTPDAFESQLQGLINQGYQPIRLSELVESSTTGKPIPDHCFVVTFDDGYANNAIYATPVLKRLGIPATLFLATGYVGSQEPYPFDDWKHKGSPSVDQETWRAATFTELENMLDSGMIEIGSHTHTHEDFRNRPDDFRSNLAESLDVLQQKFGILNPTLSLPYGIVKRGFAGPTYFESSQQLGCQCCLTTEEEVIDIGSSPFGWGRFIAEQHDTANSLGVKLDGWRDSARDLWRKIRGRRQ